MNIKPLKTNAEAIASSAQSAATQAADSFGDTVDAARERLDGVAHSLQASANDGARQVGPMVERVQDWALRSIDAGRETARRVQRSAAQRADACSQYITDQPGKSVAIAAAAGAVLAATVLLMRQRGRAGGRAQ